MITCTLRMRFDSTTRDEAAQVLRAMVGPVRAESGCTYTLLMCDVQNDAVITWVSRWNDRSDLDQHLKSTHFRRLLAVMELAAERPEVVFESSSELRGLDLIEEVLGVSGPPGDAASPNQLPTEAP